MEIGNVSKRQQPDHRANNMSLFRCFLSKNESGRIRVHSQLLYMLCIIINYNLHLNIQNAVSSISDRNCLEINQTANNLKILVIQHDFIMVVADTCALYCKNSSYFCNRSIVL